MAETEEENSELYALQPGDYSLITQAKFGTGDLFTTGHTCKEPEHKQSQHVKIITLIFIDVEGKEHTFAIPVASVLGQAFANYEFYDRIKSVLELDKFDFGC